LNDDRLFGDTAVAALFGLDPTLTVKGLPLSSYIERVHVDDRGMLKVLISKAVRDGLPYGTEYRVQNSMGAFALVMAVGRCFRDSGGNPILYSGIIYPVDQLPS
jgi:hypothetical protein